MSNFRSLSVFFTLQRKMVVDLISNHPTIRPNGCWNQQESATLRASLRWFEIGDMHGVELGRNVLFN